MTLAGIRQKAAEISGRFDLVDESWADEGMDFYIVAAQKYLDLRTDKISAKQEVSLPLVAGEYLIQLPNFRAVEGVWVTKADGSQYRLDEVAYNDLKSAVGAGGGVSAIGRGSPTVYALAPLRSSTPTVESESYRGVLLGPPSDGDYTITVQGLTWSAALTADDSVSFWSIVHPDLLVMATLLKLEEFYRNSSGRQDYLSAVDDMLRLIEWDAISEAIANMDVMSDSW